MVAVRERIRINGLPISEEAFARYFFDLWDSFDAHPEVSCCEQGNQYTAQLTNSGQRLYDSTPHKPAYFRYLTLMAFHVFLQEKVAATILEVGIGGTYDSTNIVPKPLATGITALGLDHTAILGNTIEAIAGQKGGIFKVYLNTGTQLSRTDAIIARQSCFDCKAAA